MVVTSRCRSFRRRCCPRWWQAWMIKRMLKMISRSPRWTDCRESWPRSTNPTFARSSSTLLYASGPALKRSDRHSGTPFKRPTPSKCEMYTKNKSSVCALEAAIMNGHLDCAQTLLLAGCHWQPLIVRLLSKFERGHIRIKRCDKMVPFLRTQNGRVERLENLCREKVRQTLGVVTKADYKMLPLPKIMIETNYLYNGLWY